MGGGVWYIASTVADERQAAAWDFMKYVNEPEQQALWHTEGSYLPARSDVAEDPAIQEFWAEPRPGWLAVRGLRPGREPRPRLPRPADRALPPGA